MGVKDFFGKKVGKGSLRDGVFGGDICGGKIFFIFLFFLLDRSTASSRNILDDNYGDKCRA